MNKSPLLRSKAKAGWEKVGVRQHHGIALPLTALKSKESCGIGEFFDLLPLLPWCQEIGIDVIQLLPLNDNQRDPSPYNAISSCALNPLLLSLHALPNKDASPTLKEKRQVLQKLSASSQIDYHTIFNLKMEWLKEYWKTVKPISAEQIEAFTKKKSWATPYALFKTLKSMFPNIPWWEWPATATPPQADVDFYIALQIICYEQLEKVAQHAKNHSILLMGDIPILISRDSADVWHRKDYFDLLYAAGSPPDQYNKEGQYWGFPIYRWDHLKKDNYSWWKHRLQCASFFYDIYRIDHVVGLFRIWAIPVGKKVNEGAFIPFNQFEWIPQGESILEMMLEASPMLPIAEDLGVVPLEARASLAKLGICGTKVMRWERNWNTDRSFIPVEDYPPLSLTCVSTHDSETLTLWWKNSPDEASLFAKSKGWEYTSTLSLEHRLAILKDSHQSSSLFHINLLQEYFACFPELIWPNPEDERINIPGKFLDRNWNYRFRPSVEEIISHPGLRKTFKTLVTS